MPSERQLIELISPWWGEHVFRYDQVLKKAKRGITILDLACGTGYGAYMLSEIKENQVIGGDISDEALNIANSEYKQSNLSFQKLDGTALPFSDNYFDVITSFETIEHLSDYTKLVSEFHRVLKPGGKLFLSTPNSLITSPDGNVKNPYHVQEFNPDELSNILKPVFSKVKLSGQSYTRYDNKNSLNYKLAYLMEIFFYQRGIRKLPIKFQNYFMNLLINKTQYPEINDFTLFDDDVNIKSSFVLFAVCEK